MNLYILGKILALKIDTPFPRLFIIDTLSRRFQRACQFVIDQGIFLQHIFSLEMIGRVIFQWG